MRSRSRCTARWRVSAQRSKRPKVKRAAPEPNLPPASCLDGGTARGHASLIRLPPLGSEVVDKFADSHRRCVTEGVALAHVQLRRLQQIARGAELQLLRGRVTGHYRPRATKSR